MQDTIPLTEAAYRLSVSRERALRLVLTGRLRGAKVGHAWVVDAGSIAGFLSATRQEEALTQARMRKRPGRAQPQGPRALAQVRRRP